MKFHFNISALPNFYRSSLLKRRKFASFLTLSGNIDIIDVQGVPKNVKIITKIECCWAKLYDEHDLGMLDQALS